ncbi:hypothetical protein P4H65_02650 [Paenibacillus chitinolyticus]|uniref:hypothetical protein n=1 Tax=Paenibacillus chitinolyticus TaxID=79263 RepID=UPI002DBF9523|nr:hypothetical protein [Paenibacillus chitinolyticus]MEC0244718.1 hypothetical protein [Paenibacillus chitinolyticus]
MMFYVDHSITTTSLSVPEYVASYEYKSGTPTTGSNDFLSLLKAAQEAEKHFNLPISRQQITQTGRTWGQEAADIFPDMRNLTPEESKGYHEAILKMMRPTGRKIFDL